MPVIAVVNRKGGSGKSTLATHLAAWCAVTGRSAMLGDTDSQGSSSGWLKRRGASPDARGREILGWSADPRRVMRPPAGVTHVVLDTPGGARVSATRVRALLGESRFEEAAVLLGRPFAMGGHVVRGAQLGRTLGYPTANFRIRYGRAPVHGIFAVRVSGPGLDGWPAVASLGTRPTVAGTEPLLEAHLFDFDGDLYGRLLSVEFVAKLRDERHFASLDALVVQMADDASAAREVLAAQNAKSGVTA
mgnify:CR=1 FL=1